MAIRVVKQDGSGDYTTIATALAAANRYDIIEIQDSGTYNEGNLSKITADLTIRAGTDSNGNKYTPTLDGGGTLDCAIKFYNNWVIEDLTITDYDGTATSGAGLISVAGIRVVHIKNCTLHNLTDHAITGPKSGSIISDCTIYNVRGTSSRAISAGVQPVAIDNCLIYDIQHDGIAATQQGTTVTHCTVYNSCFGEGAGGYGIVATLGTVKYCIVADPFHHIKAAGIRADTHTYNCVSGSDGATNGNFYGGAGTGDIETDPLINSSSFRLENGSPCLGAANGSSRTTDITSGSVTWKYSKKVNGINAAATPNDMGAHEFQYTTVSGVDTNKISKVISVED